MTQRPSYNYLICIKCGHIVKATKTNDGITCEKCNGWMKPVHIGIDLATGPDQTGTQC